MAEVAQLEPELIPLHQSKLQFSIHAYQQYSIEVPAGTTRENIEDRALWVHLTDKIREGAELRILPEDMAFRAEAIVTYCDGKNIRVKVFEWVELAADEEPIEQRAGVKQYKVILRGASKFCVQRLSDGEFVKERIPTKNEANDWLEKYVASLDGDQAAAAWLESRDY